MSDVYLVQPVGMSTMKVTADFVDINAGGLSFWVKEDLIYFAPYPTTAYVMLDGSAEIIRKEREDNSNGNMGTRKRRRL